MLSSFPFTRIFNQPGLATVEFAAVDAILTMPPVVNNTLTGAIGFIAGTGFYTAYSILEKLTFKSDFTPDANTGYYANQVSGFIPGDNPAVAQLLDEMIYGGRYMVKTTDFNRKMRLVGYGGPLEFTASYDVQAKGYSWAFTGQTAITAPFFP